MGNECISIFYVIYKIVIYFLIICDWFLQIKEFICHIQMKLKSTCSWKKNSVVIDHHQRILMQVYILVEKFFASENTYASIHTS